MFGVGLGIAILMDAFVIRGTLVPAFMKLAGEERGCGRPGRCAASMPASACARPAQHPHRANAQVTAATPRSTMASSSASNT